MSRIKELKVLLYPKSSRATWSGFGCHLLRDDLKYSQEAQDHLLLKVWSVDQQQQHHMGRRQKPSLSGSTQSTDYKGSAL